MMKAFFLKGNWFFFRRINGQMLFCENSVCLSLNIDQTERSAFWKSTRNLFSLCLAKRFNFIAYCIAWFVIQFKILDSSMKLTARLASSCRKHRLIILDQFNFHFSSLCDLYEMIMQTTVSSFLFDKRMTVEFSGEVSAKQVRCSLYVKFHNFFRQKS